MQLNRKIIILVNILFLCNANANQNPDDEFFANLWINELDHNIDIILIKSDDNFYIECNILSERDIDISKLSKMASRDKFCLISDRNIQSNFDASKQTINLTIPTQLFKSSTQISQLQTMPERASFGGFVNYDFTYLNSKIDRETNSLYNGLTDLGVFKDYWIFKNSIAYYNHPLNEYFTRLSTSIDFEFPKSMTQLTLGDTTTVYNPLINSLRFAGLNWGTNFTERPNFIYWNTPILQGSARVPSTVDLYINGVSIYSQRVSPGDFNLQTGAQIQQAGNAQIIVEDVLGNRSVQSFPILVTNRLLRSDLSEYNVSLGKLRYNYNIESNDYRNFFSNLYYRYGVSNWTTLGSNFSYSEDLQNLGFLWTQAISHYLVLDSVVQASHDELNNFNYSYGLSAAKDFGRVSLGASAKYTERDFKYLGDDLDNFYSYPKYEYLIYGGMSNIPLLHNIYLNYAAQSFHQQEMRVEDEIPSFFQNDRKTLNLGFNRRLGRKGSLGLSYFSSFGDDRDSGVVLSLSYSFDDDKAVYFSHSTDERTKLQFVKSNPNQVGFDYETGVNRLEDETLYNFNGRLKTDVGDLGFYHIEGDNESESQLNYRGAVVFLNNKFNFTKLVDNAFSVVSVGDYQNVDVLRSLSVVDKTNKKGYTFVHDIIPYVNYDIGFDQNQLPVEAKIPYATKRLTALDQRGYIINFPIYNTKQVTILPVDSNNHKFTAGSELYIDNDGGEVYPISSDGTVTLYGLIPNTYNIKIISTESKTCFAQLTVTENQKEESGLSTLICK